MTKERSGEICWADRFDRACRMAAAQKAIQKCCLMLTEMLNYRFPTRIALTGWHGPETLAAAIEKARPGIEGKIESHRTEFYNRVDFLFDVSAFAGYVEEPTLSTRVAFSALLDNKDVPNVGDKHIPWRDWHPHYAGEDTLHLLFDPPHAAKAGAGDNQNLAAGFHRAHEVLKRLNCIVQGQENPIQTDISDIMPSDFLADRAEEIRMMKMRVERHDLQTETAPPLRESTTPNGPLYSADTQIVNRAVIAPLLGLTTKTLKTYEDRRSTTDGHYWPATMLKTGKAAFYDAKELLNALRGLPPHFSKNIPKNDIIEQLNAGKITLALGKWERQNRKKKRGDKPEEA